MEKIAQLADWIREAKSTVVLTGAGLLDVGLTNQMKLKL